MCATLRSIDISYNDIGPEGAVTLADALGSSPSVQWINISGNQIGDKGGLSFAKAITVPVRPHLLTPQQNLRIRQLNVSHCQVGIAAYSAICIAVSSHPAMEYLFLDNPALPGNAQVEAQPLFLIEAEPCCCCDCQHAEEESIFGPFVHQKDRTSRRLVP